MDLVVRKLLPKFFPDFVAKGGPTSGMQALSHVWWVGRVFGRFGKPWSNRLVRKCMISLPNVLGHGFSGGNILTTVSGYVGLSLIVKTDAF